jgi:hypothetical protein
MKKTLQPIENCYWVAPGKLLAGEYPGAKDEATARARISALIRSGITAFIDLTEEKDGLVPYAGFLENATYQRFPIRDLSIPDSPAVTIGILDAIDQHIGRGRVVYVHCWGGVGRTGVIVGCWLARHGYKGKGALARLQAFWKKSPRSAYLRSPETKVQEQYILRWNEN